MSQDDSGQWMTKAELGKSRGISASSAERLIRRHKGWQRRTGNDGLLRVLVPAADATPDVTTKAKRTSPQDDTKVIAALTEAVAAWRGRAELSEGRLAVAEAELQKLRAEIEKLRRTWLQQLMARMRRT